MSDKSSPNESAEAATAATTKSSSAEAPEAKNAGKSSRAVNKTKGLDLYKLLEYLALGYLCYWVYGFFNAHYIQYTGRDQRVNGGIVPVYGPDLTHSLLLGIHNKSGDVEEQVEQRGKFIYPMMISNQPFKFEVYISFLASFGANGFWKQQQQHKQYGGQQNAGEYSHFTPVWESDWDLRFDIDEKHDKQLNLTLSMSDVKARYRDMYAKNKTLYLHMQIITPDIFNQQTNFKGDPKS